MSKRRSPHLCMVVHDYYPLDARVVREAKAAARAGCRVDVVCPTEPGQVPHEVIDGISVHRVGITRKRAAGLLGMIREYVGFAIRASVVAARLRIRHRAASGHVIQVHAPPDFLIVAGIVPKLLGSKLVLDIHDLSRHLYLARFADRRAAAAANRVLAWIERRACAIAHRVITVHEPYRRELIANGVADSKIAVVMNAVDDDLITRVARRNGRPSRRGPFTLAYHGTITPNYGVDLLVEALPRVLERVPDTRCMILGAGDALAAARERAAELGVTEVIEFSGRFLPIEEVLERVAGSDCGVVPNLPSELNRFALSSKLFEYVALGIPTVVARLETLATHFGPDEVTFFDPGDAASLADAIGWVATNRDVAFAKAQCAAERSRDYSWFEQRSRYLGVILSDRPLNANASHAAERSDSVPVG